MAMSDGVDPRSRFDLRPGRRAVQGAAQVRRRYPRPFTRDLFGRPPARPASGILSWRGILGTCLSSFEHNPTDALALLVGSRKQEVGSDPLTRNPELRRTESTQKDMELK